MAAKIDSLTIAGIRSFSPDDAQELSFKYPLTLIVGHNGAGKTTIIECLKYATTGEMPPNSRSGAFICDPKIVQQNQVTGKVILNFRDVNDREMSCTRIVSVTVTPKSRTMKTVDTHLKYKTSAASSDRYVSRRVAEVDVMIPLHMGVSKAILENVIFCHQEDSLWPLAEPSTLKKKFDEIFEATRYSKALDNIKALRKDQASQLKVHQANLEHYKVLKEKATRVRKTKLDAEDKIKDLETRLNALDKGEIDSVMEKMNTWMEKRKQSDNLENKLNQLVMEREMVSRQAAELHATSNLYNESEETLQKMKDQQMISLKEREHEVKLLERKKSDLLEQQERIRRSISDQLTQLGKITAEKEAYLRALNDLDMVFDDIRVQNLLPNAEDTDEFWSAGNVDNILQEFNNALENESNILNDVKRSHRQQQQVQSDALQKLQSQLTNAKEIKRMSQARFEESDRKICSLQAQLSQIQVTDSDVRGKKEELESETRALDAANAAEASSQNNATQMELNRLLNESEKKLTALSEEMSRLNAQVEGRARFEMLQESLQSKRGIYDGFVANVSDQIHISVGSIVTWSATLSQLQSSHRQKKELHVSATERLREKQKEMSGLESQLKLLEVQLAEKESWTTNAMSEINDVTNGEDYSVCLERENKEVDRLTTALASMKSAASMYTKFIEKFQDKQCCPLCDRGFLDAAEEHDFFQKLQTILERVPEARKETQEQFNQAERRRETLQKLQFKVNQHKNVKTKEIPELKSQIEQLKQQARSMALVLEQATTEAALWEGEADDLETMITEVKSIIRCEEEMKPIEVELAGLTRQLSESASQSVRTVSDVRKEYETCQNECQRIRKSIDDIYEQTKQQQLVIQNHYSNIQRIQTQLHHLQSEMSLKKTLEKDLVDEQGKRIELEVELHRAESEEAAVIPQLQKQEREIRTMQAEHTQREKQIESLISRLQQTLSAIQSSARSLQHFQGAGLEERAADSERQKALFETQLQQASENIETLRSKIELHQQQTSQVQLNLRRIEDSCKYLVLLQRRVALDGEIRTIEQEKRDFDRSILQQDFDMLKKKHEALVSERAGLMGELKQLEEYCKRLEQELRTDYKDIDSLYANQMIITTTEEMANHDLEKYRQALDRAIMKYHSLKMNEINTIIRELWHETYTGGDIDTIEIRSDDDGTKASGNRSYNYRVVMVKGDSELDMRGRCSAGQKVLTSIIVRLALAETFCLNCGILALDEPTTNLDRANIESLAKALGKIIQYRRQQSNFQLIAITHDEEFLELLGRSDYCDSYYRISKDYNSFSFIEECSIIG